MLDYFKNIIKSLDVYICSFTSLRDSISQWRLYASNATGVAIGLNIAKLNEICINNDVRFGRVLYSNDFDRLFERFIKAIMPDTTNIIKNMTKGKVRKFNIGIFSYLFFMACFIKHAGYKEEYEIRIAASSGKNINKKLHKGLYIPYREIDFDGHLLELIDEIWIGPASNQELAKRSVQLMLEEIELVDKCRIELSQITCSG